MASVSADLHDLLSRRGPLLNELVGSPKTKPELVEAVGVSRSTIDRAVRELESADLVSRSEGTVALTTRGALLLDVQQYFTEVVTNIDAVTQILSDIPVADRPHFTQFGQATIVTGSGAAPHEPVEFLKQELDEARSVRAVTLSVIPALVEQVRGRVLDGDLAVDMVVSDAVLDRLISSHQDALEATLDREEMSLYRTDTGLPYGVSVVERTEGRSSFLVLQGDGGIGALVRSDAPAAIAWADDLIDRVRDQADPV